VAHMASVTLGYEPVEWFDPDMENAKAAIRDDAAFERYVLRHGVAFALEQVSRLHRVIANQLIRSAVKNTDHSDWASRAIFICNRAKRRRGQLRRMYRDTFGPERTALFIHNFDSTHPRAEWGSALTKGNS